METELDFRLLFETTPGLVLALRPDSPVFTIIAASNGYLQATETGSKGIVGRGLFQVFPGSAGEARDTAAANLKCSLEKVLRNRTADMMAVEKYDIRGLELDGERWEERYWRGINSPVLGPAAEIAYIVHRAQDVTQYMRLKEREGQHEQLKRELQSRIDKYERELIARAPRRFSA